MEPYSVSRPHPWHGLSTGPEPPSLVNVFVEITSFDLVKYEVDKETGYLRVARAQKTSSLPPAIYGFIPQTYADREVAALMPGANVGARDPLDICVLSERPISRAEVLLHARVVGGLPMLDRGEADDKIIAIMHGDPVFGEIRELSEVPEAIRSRLTHYFATYKLAPNEGNAVVVGPAYGRAHAEKVVLAAMADYRRQFPPRNS